MASCMLDYASRATPTNAPACYQIRLNKLVLQLSIGVYPREHLIRQRVRISVDMDVERPPNGFDDDIRRVPSYDQLVQDLRRLEESPHVNLVETLAEKILDIAFSHGAVHRAAVDVEKLDAIAGVEGVGVRFERHRRIG